MRREYDYTYGSADLDNLMTAINNQKSNYGDSSMYIELAKKFDNSDYQWVIYRNNMDSNTSGTTNTTGYFVLFDKSGNTIKSYSFSYPYLCHGSTQTYIEQTSTSSTNTKYGHAYLCVSTGSTIKSNVLQTFGCDIKFTRSGSTQDIYIWTPSYSNITSKCTSGNIGNYVANNTYLYKSGSTMRWFSYSNSTYNTPVMVTLTLSSTYAQTPTVSATVTRTEKSQKIGCQLIYYSSYYRWITWDTSNTAGTISYTASSVGSGWNRTTTGYTPFSTYYTGVYIFPIWTWNPPTTITTTDMTTFNTGLWWCGSGYLERKYMLSSMPNSGSPGIVSTSANIDYYRVVNNNTTNKCTSFGLMTTDGKTIYTLNLSTLLIERIDTRIKES